VLAALPHASVQPLAYLYLSQIPYTGLDLGPVGTVLYWLGLVGCSIVLAYGVLFGALPLLHRSINRFGVRVVEVLNAPKFTPSEATSLPEVPAIRAPEIIEEHPHLAEHGHLLYDGFKSFARNGALSVEDIVKGLSRGHASVQAEVPAPESRPAPETPSTPSLLTEARYEPTLPEGEASRAGDAQTFIAALVAGDRLAVFATAREYGRTKEASRFIASVVAFLDDAYRTRIEDVESDTTGARLLARLDTATLEKLIGALATAVDASYTDPSLGVKLALMRALAVLGA
jgi:hypothetical protein